MSYDFGSQHAQGTPNFPPNYDRGEDLGIALGSGAEVVFGTDIQSDPESNGADPTSGWGKGIGIGSPHA